MDYVLHINKMKKILLVLLMFISGCQVKPQYYLYVYYAKTCPHCRSFMQVVIPKLETEYGSQMEIIKLDIDEESSIESYAKTCHLLEDYVVNDQSGSVPFIVLDGYFAWVGYQMGEDQSFLEMVHQAIAGEDVAVDNHEIYFLKRVRHFTKEDDYYVNTT
ncbi:hypothetical protein NMU03_12400 [Allocoprobacillus halotolerans]|uniref:Thioredoxin domain-containing protein n=1 Tax=Allocoprobacillus halotolerans TaxID=2944914 RepID=A0ABY5I3B6_9FIRM|nr:thioredoxin domain-containing protein [Allocoprobacillus halotolerans]UTY38447.1 hypothetical protein NMU03_12400 [Allocoprobacillus halotolerans]